MKNNKMNELTNGKCKIFSFTIFNSIGHMDKTSWTNVGYYHHHERSINEIEVNVLIFNNNETNTTI